MRYHKLRLFSNSVGRLLIIVLFSTFFISAFFFKKDLKLVSATSETWSGGTAGSGSGKEFYFKIKIQTSKPIIFDSVWINNKMLATYLANNRLSISQEPIKFTRNDTIIVRASESSLRPSAPSNRPNNFSGEASIRYYLDGKMKYLNVKKITINKSVNRQ
jgi:hypothetical protein